MVKMDLQINFDESTNTVFASGEYGAVDTLVDAGAGSAGTGAPFREARLSSPVGAGTAVAGSRTLS